MIFIRGQLRKEVVMVNSDGTGHIKHAYTDLGYLYAMHPIYSTRSSIYGSRLWDG